MRILPGLLVLVACSASHSETPQPDPTVGAGGTSSISSVVAASSSSSSSSGMQGGVWESGKRLRGRYWSGEDGSRQFVGWYDSMLKTNCQEASATDAKFRCLPIGGAVNAFADPKCATSPLATVSKACTTTVPAFVSMTGAPPDQCSGSGNREFPVLPTKVPVGTTVYMGATCTPTMYEGSTWDLYPTGPEADPKTFVEMTLATD